MPTVRTNGVQAYCEEYEEGLPIVLHHGATSNHRLWAERARPLAADYRIIVYVLRGHGRTGGSERTSYTTGLYAEDLGAFINALELDRPAICGLSLGGMIAQTYAAESPETISALCTLGTRTPEILDGEWVERRLVPKIGAILSPVVDPNHIMELLYRFYAWRSDDDGTETLRNAERIQNEHAADFPAMADAEVGKVHDLLRRYPAESVAHSMITIPSLLLYGERESEVAGPHAEYMADTIPVAEVRRIPNAGHNSHVDNPEFILDLLREFLAIAVGDRYEINRSDE